MRVKISPKQSLLIAILVIFAILIFLGGISFLRFKSRAPTNPVARNSVPNYEGASVRPDVATRLRIPVLKVDAAIEDLGLTPQGDMDVPKGPDDVAWFDLGTRPGEVGSAVIAGHEGWKDNIPAVFDNLYTLKKGDKVYVDKANGTTMTFVIRDIRTYDKNANTSGVFKSSDGKAHLNLITCKGVWDSAQKSYSDRLVIFTDEK